MKKAILIILISFTFLDCSKDDSLNVNNTDLCNCTKVYISFKDNSVVKRELINCTAEQGNTILNEDLYFFISCD